MADSPVKGMGEGYLSVLVLIDGTEVPKTMVVESVDIVKELNKIPYARITLKDGDTREQKFPTSEDAMFEPGKEVEVKAGYGPGKEETLYKGILVEHGIKQSNYSGAALVLKCKDEALKLTVGRKNKVFYDQADSDIISAVVSEAGLSADVEGTSGTHKKLIQYWSTDWDFIQSRADVNSLVTIINDGEITIKKPTVSEKSELVISYGNDLVEMDMNIDSTHQYTEVGATSWSHTDLAIVTANGAKPTVNAQGDLDSGKLGAVIEPKNTVKTTPPVTKDVIQSWADSVYQRGHLSRIRGSLKFYGSAKAELGKTIELFGFGTRFVGDAYVSRIRHTVTKGQWLTEVGLGMDPQPYMEANITASSRPAGGMLPAIHGLQHGVVKQIDSDPDGEFRVLINIPIIDDQAGEGVWARMAHYYATEDCGFVFYPEVGDEVVVGFFNSDPTYPVILGSMYSSGRGITTEETHIPADPNIFKSISINKGKTRIELQDDPGKNIVKIITEDKMIIELNDDEDTILIEDPVNVNKMLMDKNGILFETDGDFVVKAKKNIKMEADINIETKSKSDTKMEAVANFSIKALAVKGEGSTTMELKGSASAKLEGGGLCEVKGGLVKIN